MKIQLEIKGMGGRFGNKRT